MKVIEFTNFLKDFDPEDELTFAYVSKDDKGAHIAHFAGFLSGTEEKPDDNVASVILLSKIEMTDEDVIKALAGLGFEEKKAD